MANKKLNCSTNLQSGATLIEALVSLLVMSLGLLGLAALQLNALSYQKSSWATHRVSELVIDASERIKANPLGVYTFANTYSVASASSGAPVSNNCRSVGAADCTVSQIINDDLAAIAAKARTSLPGGAIRIDNLEPRGIVLTAMYRDKDFVDSAGVPIASDVCNAQTGVKWRNCCPSEAAVPNGVRCSRMDILP